MEPREPPTGFPVWSIKPRPRPLQKSPARVHGVLLALRALTDWLGCWLEILVLRPT